MTNPLTVGVDGSDPSLRAIDWAVSEAALHHVPLRLLHASLWEHYDRVRPQIRSVRAAGDVMAEHIAASAAERAAKQDPTVAVSTEISPREGVAALLQAADDSFALVLGNRGRGNSPGWCSDRRAWTSPPARPARSSWSATGRPTGTAPSAG